MNLLYIFILFYCIEWLEEWSTNISLKVNYVDIWLMSHSWWNFNYIHKILLRLRNFINFFLFILGWEEFEKLVVELEKERKPINVFFTGDKDESGQSWCPYCNQARPGMSIRSKIWFKGLFINDITFNVTHVKIRI